MEELSPDIKVDWVRMAKNVLRYNDVIVGKFFNKGSWASEAWIKEHSEEFEDGHDGPPERIDTGEERRERLQRDQTRESSVCVKFSGTPPPHGVWLTSAGRGTQMNRMSRPINQRTGNSKILTIAFCCCTDLPHRIGKRHRTMTASPRPNDMSFPPLDNTMGPTQ